MKNLRASFNRAYGLFAFDCKGGRMTKSVGYGQGDSAYYVGETPAQSKPKWTKLDHLDGHENVLGYSGTNSKYVKITKSNFYNNGAGVVPNTLDSERFEPTATGIIENNNIFWNNFNYFLPNSRVKTVSNGLGQIGGLTINYPTGVGVVLLGADGWIVQNNNDLRQLQGRGAGRSRTRSTRATTRSRRTTSSSTTRWAEAARTPTQVDFFSDGSGSAQLLPGQRQLDLRPGHRRPTRTCTRRCPAPPAPAPGTGTSAATMAAVRRSARATSPPNPPETQQCSWAMHDHPAFEKFTAARP